MRNGTEQVYGQKANEVIDIVSANLHGPLPPGAIAARISESQRQSLRIMRSVLNEPLAAYVATPRAARAVYTLRGGYPGLARLYDRIRFDTSHVRRHAMLFEKQYLPPLAGGHRGSR